MLIKVIGRAVRGRDNNDACVKQCLEQTADQHCIGNVGDLHFVKGQKPHIRGQFRCYWRNRIIDAALSGLGHFGMNPLHKCMKMTALLGGLDLIVKQIHQHGFTAPHTTPHIQTRRRGRRFAEKSAFGGGLGKRCADAL